jgi:DNA repair protein RecO (recombination protein O)
LATRDLGVQSAIAKGALRPKSRFGGALQLFSEGIAHLHHGRGELGTLAAYDVTNSHAGLARDLSRFTTASALAELISQFVLPGPHPQVFEVLRHGLGMLEATPPELGDVVGLRVMWQMVDALGVAPSVDRCARDGASLPSGDTAFSFRDGGLLCNPCAVAGASTRLAPDDCDALRALVTGTEALHELDELHAAAHRRLLARWVASHLGEGKLPAIEAWQRGDYAPVRAR